MALAGRMTCRAGSGEIHGLLAKSPKFLTALTTPHSKDRHYAATSRVQIVRKGCEAQDFSSALGSLAAGTFTTEHLYPLLAFRTILSRCSAALVQKNHFDREKLKQEKTASMPRLLICVQRVQLEGIATGFPATVYTPPALDVERGYMAS